MGHGAWLVDSAGWPRRPGAGDGHQRRVATGFWPDGEGTFRPTGSSVPLNVPCNVHDEWADRLTASRELAKINAGLGEYPGAVHKLGRAGGRGPRAGTQSGASGGAERRVVPAVEQVGDPIVREPVVKNWVKKFDLLNADGTGGRFFCTDPPRAGGEAKKGDLLDERDHPRITFAYPVKNVHIELVDLGRAGDASARLRMLWDAEFAQGGRRISEVAGSMPSQGGDMPRMRRLCPPSDTPWRLELHVTADDPRRTDEAPDVEDPDRGVDETIQYEVRLVPEGHPLVKRMRFHQEFPVRRTQTYLPFIRDGPSIESCPPCGPCEAMLLLRQPHRPSRSRRRRDQAFL